MVSRMIDKAQKQSRLLRRKADAMPTAESSPIILTLGHSTRTLDEFIRLLQAHGVSRVVDVRTVPRSRHNPQFNKASLPRALKKAGLGYVHLPGLGGLRHAKRDSLNVGWRNASFRGFADYMQTPEFEQSLEELIQLATEERVALMCAEAVPWRCHRSLIADALLVHRIRTEDIMSLTRRQVHTLTPFSKVCGTTITYPPENQRSTQRKSPPKRSRRHSTEKANWGDDFMIAYKTSKNAKILFVGRRMAAGNNASDTEQMAKASWKSEGTERQHRNKSNRRRNIKSRFASLHRVREVQYRG